MKKVFFILILSANFLTAQNWFPLEVGNKWQIFLYSAYGGIPTYGIKNIFVYDTTIINNKKYFLLSNINLIANTPIRFDTDSNKVYININSQDYLHMDFNPGLQYFYQYFNSGGSVFGQQVLVISGNTSLFGQLFPYRGWRSYPPFSQEAIYISDLGISDLGVADDGKIIQAILVSSDTLFDHGYKPSIVNFQPPDTIFTNSIHLTLRINHYFNRFVNPNAPGYPLNYIDNVVLYGFYTNFIDTIPHPSLNGISTHNSNLWSIDIILDTSLLSNKYFFFFRISATDKGIIQHTIFDPDTGYYMIKYLDSLTLNVNNTDVIPDYFFMYQNYPNPFNPSTKIKYAIGSPQYATLKVYDILGNEVATLVDEYKPAGSYEVEFSAEGGQAIDNKQLASGIYFYRLKAGEFVETKKMILLR